MKLKLTELTEKITPLPLKASPCVSGSHMGIIIASNKELVASVADQETAAYFVHACNTLPKLVEALNDLEREISSRFGSYEDMSQPLQTVMIKADKALTLARDVEI